MRFSTVCAFAMALAAAWTTASAAERSDRERADKTTRIWAACQSQVAAIKAQVPAEEWNSVDYNLKQSIIEIFFPAPSELPDARRDLMAQDMPEALKAYYLCMVDTLISLDRGEDVAQPAAAQPASPAQRPSPGPSGFASAPGQTEAAVAVAVAPDASVDELQACIKPIDNGSFSGALQNSCDVNLSVKWCVYQDHKGPIDPLYDCRRTIGSGGGALTLISAGQMATAGVLDKQVLWLACRRPAYPSDVRFESAPTPQLVGNCR